VDIRRESLKTLKHISKGNFVDPEEVAGITTEPYGAIDEETSEPTLNCTVAIILKSSVVIYVADGFGGVEQAHAYAQSIVTELQRLH
jgi:hypothetical protein